MLNVLGAIVLLIVGFVAIGGWFNDGEDLFDDED